MGLEGYNDRPDDEWLKDILRARPEFPELETLRDEGIYLLEASRPVIAFSKQIEEPEKYPFPTRSGKIEIYSSIFAEKNDPLIPPVPKYIPQQEDPDNTSKGDYPIQLVSPHSRARINSQLYNINGIKHLADDDLWLNTADAKERDIKNGDKVYVFNDYGRIRVKAKVTDRIISGVASIDQGRWYNPDKSGIDSGGCSNVLTADFHSPAGAFPSNSCLVQIAKA